MYLFCVYTCGGQRTTYRNQFSLPLGEFQRQNSSLEASAFTCRVMSSLETENWAKLIETKDILPILIGVSSCTRLD